MGRVLAFLLCGGLIASPAWPRVHDARPGPSIARQPAEVRDLAGHASLTAAEAVAAHELSGPSPQGPTPRPVAPIGRARDEPRPAWGGSIGLMERYVRRLLERAAAVHRHNEIMHQPLAGKRRRPKHRPG